MTASSTEPGDVRNEAITRDELALATRNHGMPLESLRYDVTPTGLHYLLVHYDIPPGDAASWTLRVEGNVARPLDLSVAELRRRPAVSAPVTLECAGNGRALLEPRALSQPWLHEAVGTGEWTGTPLAPLLDDAGTLDDTIEVVFEGADRGIEAGQPQVYTRSLALDEARRDDVLVAYALNGAPLPPQHGYPLRLLVPGWYGMASVKWLTTIRAVTEPFAGYQQTSAYVYRRDEDDPGEPVTRIAVRSLMIPPGVPDFFTRRRFVAVGPCRLEGRAWSGHGAVERVAVSVDGGSTWHDADLEPHVGRHAWRGWHWTWHAEPGERELCCRATDAAGNTQPLEGDWNVGGYRVNAVQRVPVTVTADGNPP